MNWQETVIQHPNILLRLEEQAEVSFKAGQESRDAEIAELQDHIDIQITLLNEEDDKMQAAKQEGRREVAEWVTDNFLKVKFPAWYPDSTYGKAWDIQLKEWGLEGK